MADIKRYRDGLEEVPSVRELRTELRDATRSVGRGPQGDPYNVRNVHLAEDETVALLLPGLASTVAERAGSASDASTSGAQDSDPALEKFKRKMAAVGRKVVTSAPAGSASNAVRRTSPKEKLKLVLPPRASTAPAAQMRPAISSAQVSNKDPYDEGWDAIMQMHVGHEKLIIHTSLSFTSIPPSTHPAWASLLWLGFKLG
jgi:hypothetical protein